MPPGKTLPQVPIISPKGREKLLIPSRQCFFNNLSAYVKGGGNYIIYKCFLNLY